MTLGNHDLMYGEIIIRLMSQKIITTMLNSLLDHFRNAIHQRFGVAWIR